MEKNDWLYNIDLISQACQGQSPLINQMVQLFCNTVPAGLKDLITSYENKNYQELKNCAHKLKTNIDLMGIESLRMEIRAIENFEKIGYKEEELGKMIHHVVEQMDLVIKQLENRNL